MDLFKLVARLGMDSSEYERGISKARGSFSQLGESIGAKAVAMGNLISRSLEKAVNVAVDLGKSAIQNASDVVAEQAQFQATFGVMQGEAEKAFSAIEKATGIMDTRLQKVGTKAFSQFKGAGLAGSEALGMMEKHTNLAADAAAYYDISIEDADERLRSFLRGNTEAGDAIGLFTSESQRNSAAMEKYGQKWQNLTESQKQMLMLDISEDIYKQSGAIGQAARESDAWTNVVGNLKEAWRQTLGVVGAPIAFAITPVIQKITDFLNDEKVQLRFDQFGLTIANIANATFNGVESLIEKLTTEGTQENGLMDSFGGFAGSLAEVAKLTFDKVTGFLELMIGGPDGMDDTVSNISMFVSDISTFIANHAEAIATLIGVVTGFFAISNPAVALIAALVLIAANWEDVKEWTDDALTAAQNFWKQKVSDPISGVLQTIEWWLSEIISKTQTAIDKLAELFGFNRSDFNPDQDVNDYWTPAPSTGGDYDSGWGSDYYTGRSTKSIGSINDKMRAAEAQTVSVLATRETYSRTDSALLEEIRALRQEMAQRRDVFTPDGRMIGEMVTETVSRNIARSARR